MKIILAAPQDRTVLGIIGGYCRDALCGMGHEVRIFDFREKPYARGVKGNILRALRRMLPASVSLSSVPAVRSLADKRVNGLLIEEARKEKPRLLLVLMGENISGDTIDAIRRQGTVAVNWMADTFLLPYRLDLFRETGAHYDRYFAVDSPEIIDRLGLKAGAFSTLPMACAPAVHKEAGLSSRDKEFYGSRIAFVGSLSPERERVLDGLADKGLKIWGRWGKESPRLKGCYRRKDIYGAEAAKVYAASDIVVDIHGLFFKEDQVYNVTPRVFEVPASGGFLLTNECRQLGSLYRIGEEMAVYRGADELKEKIFYYLSHPEERRVMAKKARARCLREHTYEDRLRSLLKMTLGGA